MREFFAYKIQKRDNGFSLLLNSRKLYQQFLFDAYTMIKAERFSYIHNQQKKVRTDDYLTINQAVNEGNNDGSSIGKRILFPSSFTGLSMHKILFIIYKTILSCNCLQN